MLFASEPRFAPALVAYERWLVARRHPCRRAGGSLVRFLVRRAGHVAGRVAAHHAPGDDATWFGALDCADDVDAVRALVGAVASWRDDTPIVRGPALWSPADGDAGVLVAGFEHAGGTGRPWHPPWYADHLAAVGFEPDGAPIERWRRPTLKDRRDAVRHAGPSERPPHAGRLGDPALVLSTADGEIAAVPDVSRLRRPAVEASVVRCEGDAGPLVDALLAVASASSYEALWCPLGDDERPPDTVHHVLVADRNRLV